MCLSIDLGGLGIRKLVHINKALLGKCLWRFRREGTILHCRMGSLPMKYLGMLLGTPYKTASVWNSILERMEKKLSGWKRFYLSKGGRLTLVKITLSSLPMYYLSLFVIPIAVANRLEVFREIFYGALQRSVFNILWWLGRRCVYR